MRNRWSRRTRTWGASSVNASTTPNVLKSCSWEIYRRYRCVLSGSVFWIPRIKRTVLKIWKHLQDQLCQVNVLSLDTARHQSREPGAILKYLLRHILKAVWTKLLFLPLSKLGKITKHFETCSRISRQRVWGRKSMRKSYGLRYVNTGHLGNRQAKDLSSIISNIRYHENRCTLHFESLACNRWPWK